MPRNPALIVFGGLIAGGGLNRLAAAARDHDVHLIRTDSKVSLTRSAGLRNRWVVFSAALHQAEKAMAKGGRVLLTTSWFDEYEILLGSAGSRNSELRAKLLNSWSIISRIIDRSIMRVGGVYFVTHRAIESTSVFTDLSPNGHNRSDVFSIHQSGCQSIEDFFMIQSIWAAIQPAVVSTYPVNLNGSMAEAKWLLVGDVTRQRFKHFDHWPFHDDSGAAFYITKILNNLGVPEPHLAWANANPTSGQSGQDEIRQLLAQRPSLKVVALGKSAAKTLREIGIEVHASVPHPSWARRFNKTCEYTQALEQVFCSSVHDNDLRIPQPGLPVNDGAAARLP